jgi:CRISPR-associated endonuclease/helicase Cas3
MREYLANLCECVRRARETPGCYVVQVGHFAHSKPGRPLSEWHLLTEHLDATSSRAEEFAHSYSAGWGRLAGLWHDAGKYQQAFQDYLKAEGDHTRAPHSAVGARIAYERRAASLPFVIAGHHGGLPNKTHLLQQLADAQERLVASRESGLPASLEAEAIPCPPSHPAATTAFAMWTRFLFGALVDADFLDTEAFLKSGERDMPEAALTTLRARVDEGLDAFATSNPTVMNLLRRRVLDECRSAADWPPGFFSLTVPTGGGKTLSSLSFALRHAVRHGLRRVIFVVPFTSIIDQTARAYRDILGERAVLEHHSNLDPERETPLNRLASENWDAPVIVTTAVQFLESLYANRPSRCRKLHRIARSVVVFDEAQTFEPRLLSPIMEALRNLVTDYGVSVVLCTATQPRLDLDAREIMRDAPGEFAIVRDRCSIQMPADSSPVEWEQLASELARCHQALAIVDRRADAEALARLTGDACLHLSGRMCPKHRLDTIDAIKERLRRDEPCVVVSTQLVEAGVDLDFPLVYRAFAGAGSMAQAAGRCNREGRIERGGELRIFFPPQLPPTGILRMGYQRAYGMWQEGILDLADPATFTEYFRRLYSLVDTDPGVLAAERELRFEDSAALFRLIEETGEQVVAPWLGGEERMRQLDFSGITRGAMRSLQPFLVTLYAHECDALRRAGAIVPIAEGIRVWRLLPPFRHLYDDRFGFGWQGPVAAEPEGLIA